MQNDLHTGPLRVVVAMDKFRGSLKAVEAAEAVRDGLLHSGREVDVRLFPMADGGEGSLDVVESELRDVERIEVDSVNHLGYSMKVPVLLFGQEPRSAFIEMAAVCGLNLIPKDYRNLLRSTSFGLGDVMQKVIEGYGVRKLIVAIGGSGTSDGGFGMVSALGFRFVNPTPMRNKDVPSFISGITEVDDRGVESICPHLRETTIQVACDVTNPLLGPDGAVAVYSGQKGCKPADKPVLEAAMENWADVVGRWYTSEKQENVRTLSDFPGSGAAGGVGFAMKYMLGAELRPGWELFSEMIDLEDNIAAADLVITGEGSFDESSLFGKLPHGIASLCRKYNKPLWVIAGRSRVEPEQWRALGIERVEELVVHAQEGEDSIRDARAILSRICRNFPKFVG